MQGDTAGNSPYARLARHVRARREELNMTQNEVQMAGGPSAAAVRYIEAGKEARPTARTMIALERALGWEHGSVMAILEGGEPVIAAEQPTPAPAPATEDTEASVRALRNMLAELETILDAQRRAAAASTAITPDTMDAARIIAAREHRTVADVIAEALTLYSEVMGGDK